MLPSPELEQEFLASLRTNMDEISEDYLETLIQKALDRRRPALAGEIFALLPPSIEANPALEKAEQALRLMLLNVPDHPDEQYWEEVSSQWTSLRNSGPLKRLRSRHRQSSSFGSRSWRRK